MMNKFMRHVEMSDREVAEYVADPAASVERWLAGGAGTDAATDDRAFTEQERAAFSTRDYEALYLLGVHPYLLWHFTEAVYEHEYREGFGWRELVEQYRAAVAQHEAPDYVV